MMLSDTTMYMLAGLFMTKAIQLWLPINKLPVKYRNSIRLFIAFSYLFVGLVGLLVYHGSLPTIIIEAFVILLTILVTLTCAYALVTRSYNLPNK